MPLLKINFRQLITFIFLVMFSPAAFAQSNNPVDPGLNIYRAAPSKINDLIHTKLDVRFDYGKCHLLGKEWVTLKPHFYATDTVRLDAKGMDLHEIAVLKNGKYKPLKYKYDDSTSIAIRLALCRFSRRKRQLV
jgi:aminopeptidase N